MIRLTSLALASVAALGIASSALAADLDPIEMATDFDWSGPYANVSVVGVIDAFNVIPPMGGVSGTVGIGGTVGQFYFGVEGNAALVGTPGFIVGALSTDLRVGVAVTESALIYTLGGVGELITTGGMLPYVFAGLGAEYAIGDDMTLRAQYQMDASVTLSHVGKVGVSWYF